MAKKHFNVYVEADLAEWVEAESKRRRCSSSQVIKEALLVLREGTNKLARSAEEKS